MDDDEFVALQAQDPDYTPGTDACTTGGWVVIVSISALLLFVLVFSIGVGVANSSTSVSSADNMTSTAFTAPAYTFDEIFLYHSAFYEIRGEFSVDSEQHVLSLGIETNMPPFSTVVLASVDVYHSASEAEVTNPIVVCDVDTDSPCSPRAVKAGDIHFAYDVEQKLDVHHNPPIGDNLCLLFFSSDTSNPMVARQHVTTGVNGLIAIIRTSRV